MSGVCFPPKNDAATSANTKEYENMVVSAETKCSQLKEQLERMKQIYNKQNTKESPKSEKTISKPLLIQVQPKQVEVKDAVVSASKPSDVSIYSLDRKCPLIRQNSHAISTDTTGAALGTINSILTGITDSIKVPEYFPETLKKTNTQHSKQHHHRIARGVEGIKIKTKRDPIVPTSSISIKSKSKVIKVKKNVTPKAPSKASLHTIKTIRKNKRSLLKFTGDRLKSGETAQVGTMSSTIPIADKRSRKALKRLRPPTLKSYNNVRNKTLKRMSAQDLVELYHNQAVKESHSSDSNETKNKNQKSDGIDTCVVIDNHREQTLVPPLEIEELQQKGYDLRMLSAFSRNYEMPTVSSRMKQVAKYYMNSFNLKTIPFCPATSTGPSHNIGINIQQVMNMVKNKNPSQKLSPTLAYNIGLAAGRWSNKPLSVLVTNMTSRILSQCPLSKSMMNYQQLQEAAKTVPQDVIEETDENLEDAIQSPETQSVYITGPSGDIKVQNRKQTVWSATSSFDDKKCTCAPQKGVEFQQIINKYGGGCSIENSQQQLLLPIKKSKMIQPKTISEVLPPVTPIVSINPLDGKEKKLKEVMTKLHDEFEAMNKTYEELSRKTQGGKKPTDRETTKELEMLDKQLNSKEEEILMVMTLYKEVLALKQQVKDLKERTSKEAVSVKSQVSKINGYNTTTTAGLLNKLLKQVQHFQTHYKKA